MRYQADCVTAVTCNDGTRAYSARVTDTKTGRVASFGLALSAGHIDLYRDAEARAIGTYHGADWKDKRTLKFGPPTLYPKRRRFRGFVGAAYRAALITEGSLSAKAAPASQA